MPWDYSKVFQTLGTEVIGPLFIGSIIYIIILLKDKWAKKKKEYSFKITAEKNDRIQEILFEMRIMLKADRAYFGLFHNGSKYIEGSEILKKSRVNESVGPGTSLEAMHYQDMLISLVPDEMKLIAEEGPSFTKVEDLKDGKFKRMCQSRGVLAVARCAVRKGQDIIGYVGLDYAKSTEKPENIEGLCKYAGFLEQVLTDYRIK